MVLTIFIFLIIFAELLFEEYYHFITIEMRGVTKLPLKNIIKQIYPLQIMESNVKQPFFI